MLIGQGVKLIGKAHQGLVSFWGDPWYLGFKETKLVALSTVEAEYIAAGHCCAIALDEANPQGLWLQIEKSLSPM
jgi:hypothetical protein